MKLNTLSFLILVLLVTAMPVSAFSFEVTARVDKNKITPADSIFLKVEIQGGKADLDLSMIRDFKVASQGTTSSYNYINGKSQSTFSCQYVLTPLSKGELIIPSIKASRDGEEAFTREIIITVTDEPAAADEVRALFSKAEISEKKIFMGQAVVYSLKFFTSKRLSGLGFETPPEFNGFLAKPFDQDNNYTETLGGILFQVTQADYLLFPLQPGTFTLNPAVLVANVVVKSDRNSGIPSFFNDPFFSSDSYKPVRVASNLLTLEVLPLPPYQGKGVFSGLVGRFSIDAAMDKTSLKAGESATLTIRLSGSGNIMDAGPPSINMDQDAFKTYDDNPVESIHLTQKGYEGEKVFKKAVVPVNPGQYVIPPVVLVYFDTETETYKEVSTLEIPMTVTPSGAVHMAETPEKMPSGNAAVVQKEVVLVNRDILEIKEGLEALTPYRDIRPSTFAFLILIPAFLCSGVKSILLVRKKEDSIEKIMQEKAKRHLKEAGKMNAQNKDFLAGLYSSLVASVLSKAGKKGETLTLAEAKSILMETGADNKLSEDVACLLEKIESARFGREKIDGKEGKTLLSEVRRVVRMLCLALFCFGLFSFFPQKSMADPALDFINGLNQYKSGNFKEAASIFESLAAGPAKRPYLYYNTGNAYLKAGDLGRAVLWYERARQMIPNDPDLLFNLDYAMGLVKDKKESSPGITDILFSWNRFFPAGIIQGLAVFFSFVFFTWSSVRIVKNKKIFSGPGMILCMILTLMTLMALVQYMQKAYRMDAVIVKEEVPVRSGTSDAATKLFSLHAGTKISVEDEREGYLKIRFSKDRAGWVKIMDAVKI